MVEMGGVDTAHPYHIVCNTDGIALYPSRTEPDTEASHCHRIEATGMDISVERIDLRFPLNLLVRGVQVIQPIQADKQISSVPGDSLP